ncbi:TRAFs-binding domain-containing protein [Tunturibacter psychrotolerans]|uniref:TRAFs-binding domain-containing protein n=1 Tax=Tunturiibacter psychrotolerans TaxID=3069686 RepID=A0AAU7ZPU6_9BACT
MEQVKTCYVAIPFGRKTSLSSQIMTDFDQIYAEVLRPAALDAGYEVIRANELSGVGMIHKAVLERIIASEVFLADVTTADPNVMYELGLRHALRSGTTLLVMESGSQLPFDITYARALIYRTDDAGRVTGYHAEQFRRDLSSAIRQGIGRRGSDSPIYEFFPQLHVDLPEELSSVQRKRGIYPAKARRPVGSRSRTSDASLEIKQAEEVVRNTEDVDPAAVIDILRRYRENSAWDDLIRFADELPVSMREMPQVQQMMALALNRRGGDSDQARAIHLMTQLIERTGGDSETYGILGSIYKGRYESSGNPDDLASAVTSYRSGFEKQPSDFYLGINLVSLLAIHGGEEARALLGTFVPLVRRALVSPLQDERADFWTLAAALELATISRNWAEAFALVERMISQHTTEWMFASTAIQLAQYGRSMTEDDRSQLQRLMKLIKWQSAVEERNA